MNFSHFYIVSSLVTVCKLLEKGNNGKTKAITCLLNQHVFKSITPLEVQYLERRPYLPVKLLHVKEPRAMSCGMLNYINSPGFQFQLIQHTVKNTKIHKNKNE